MYLGKRPHWLVSGLAAVAIAVTLAYPAVAQDEGRPTDSGGASTRPRPRPRPRPKKRISISAPTEAAKVPTSFVIIRSQPPNAEVVVDGKLVGTTADDGELELGELKLGPHLILLRKDGYRQWSQTVTLKTTEPVEVKPLLQSVNAPVARDLSKLPVVEFGKPISGQLSRDDQEAADGSGFYDELVIRVKGVAAFLITFTASGFEPSLVIMDDDNRATKVIKVGENRYQTISVPRGGTYYLRISAQIDESTFVGGDYTVTVELEGAAPSARLITPGQTGSGHPDERAWASGPNDSCDAWTFEGRPRARIMATSGVFTPGLTLSVNNFAVAASGSSGVKQRSYRLTLAAVEGS